LLSAPEPWATIEYETVSSSDVVGDTRLCAARDGVGHGLGVWFDAKLLDGIAFSNAPSGPELVYGTAFFPWPEAVPLWQGDEIQIRIEARLVGEDYIWRWDSTVTDRKSPQTPKAEFRQSTFHSAPFVPARLARGAAARVPVLSEKGQMERFILDSIDGAATNQEIAQKLMNRFPTRFPRFNDALGHVGAVARRFALD
jgi:protein arginine N-methyltransferase 1